MGVQIGERELDTRGWEIWGKHALYKLPLFLDIIILGRDLTHSFGFLSSFHPEQGAQSGIVQARDILNSAAFQRLQPQPRPHICGCALPLAGGLFHSPLSDS